MVRNAQGSVRWRRWAARVSADPLGSGTNVISRPGIQPGIVLHLDPSTLEAEGATYSVERSYRVDNEHYFVCLVRDDERAKWIPVFSNAGDGREELAQAEKQGHPGWTRGTSFYHPAQIWDAPHDAVIEAARVGNDLSRAGQRNAITTAALDRIRGQAGV